MKKIKKSKHCQCEHCTPYYNTDDSYCEHYDIPVVPISETDCPNFAKKAKAQ